MKVPVQITVGGKKVSIAYPETILDDDGSPLAGEMICGEHKVRISRSKNKTPQDVFRTLWHELLHYALEITGHSSGMKDEYEEPIVYGLEMMLADLYTFSPAAPIRWKEIPWETDDE